jgi:hypothetical protein
MKAHDYLKQGETALVIFTHGPNFRLGADASGESGEWVINPRRSVDRVIIYRRERDAERSEIYLASYAGTHPSRYPGRYVVDLAHVQYAGTTECNWYEFAGDGQNPLRYVQG